MTQDEFAQMVDYIEDLWGPSNAWLAASRLFDTFEDLDTDQVYACLLARRDGDPEKARFAPKPAELRALALDRMRARMPRRALPETTERYGWEEFCRRKYGKVISLREAVERAAGLKESVR